MNALWPNHSLVKGEWALAHYCLWLGGLSLLIIAAGWSAVNVQVAGLYHDDGIYAAVAKSIAEGEGYRIASLPTNPAQTKYPFLYPLLLSLFWNLDPRFPENLFLLKTFNIACLIGIFIFSFIFHIGKVARLQWDALLFAILVVFNPVVFSFAEFLLSDLLFSLLVLVAITFFSEVEDANASLFRLASFASLTALIFLTKPAGLPLAIAAVSAFILRRYYLSMLVYTVILLVIVSPWFWWVAAHSGEANNPLLSYYVRHDKSHVAIFSVWANPRSAFEIIWANLNYIKDSVTHIAFMGYVPGLSILVLSLLGLGSYRLLQKGLALLHVFVLLYVGMLTVWPWHPLRYLVPMVPLVVFLFFQGIYQIQDFVSKLGCLERWKMVLRLIAHCPLVFVVALELIWISNYLPNTAKPGLRLPYGLQLPSYGLDGFAETFEWIRKNTDESAVLATAYDPAYFLYTGRKAVRPGFHNPESYFYPYQSAKPDVGLASTVKKNLTELGARYLIMDRIAGFAEQVAQETLMIELLQLYSTQPDLLFVSQDSLHKVYALP